jgi:hypothetical protein
MKWETSKSGGFFQGKKKEYKDSFQYHFILKKTLAESQQ